MNRTKCLTLKPPTPAGTWFGVEKLKKMKPSSL
jgi:hypothetical protein